jgi:hypothetical protein
VGTHAFGLVGGTGHAVTDTGEMTTHVAGRPSGPVEAVTHAATGPARAVSGLAGPAQIAGKPGNPATVLPHVDIDVDRLAMQGVDSALGGGDSRNGSGWVAADIHGSVRHDDLRSASGDDGSDVVNYSAMRDVQAGGRYVLYAALFAVAFGGSEGRPALQGVLLALVIAGVPSYWFWRRSVHIRWHDARPSPSCSHCRARLAYQREQMEREQMAHLNQRYRT